MSLDAVVALCRAQLSRYEDDEYGWGRDSLADEILELLGLPERASDDVVPG